jgi:amidase
LTGAQLYAGIAFSAVHDIYDAVELSGEPLVEGLSITFGTAEQYKPESMKEYYELNLRFREYQEKYAEYWESTKSLTGTG